MHSILDRDWRTVGSEVARMWSSRDVVVIEASDAEDLEQIHAAHVQAVVVRPQVLPPWFSELAEAVYERRFVVPRTILGDAGAADIAAWLGRHLPIDALPQEAGRALRDDILGLVERVGRSTGGSRFQFRVLTGTPSLHCGFHVDTVRPGVPQWGLLRVYTGAGTQYALPDDVTGVGDFYRYLRQRKQLVHELVLTSGAARAALRERLGALDGELGFLRPGARLATAPAGSIVAFKHLDLRLHGSEHDPRLAWIHASPVAGDPRFLVSVTAARPV
jgi:hypothetical protein